MYSKPIGISILTNGNRLASLQDCIDRLLTNCYYRPLVVAIYDNGSTDDTKQWLQDWILNPELNPWKYGVEFRVDFSPNDLGCAAGTNASIDLVRDCEFSIHLESDFGHLPPELTGEDKLWLRRAVEFMQTVDGNFMYLRRMTGEQEMLAHWWSQWMGKIEEQKGRYLSCPGFWWSNNPALIRTQTLFDNGTLPLDVVTDGPKGTPGWSQPELRAKAPGKAWLHHWGLFVHDIPTQGQFSLQKGCGVEKSCGSSTCKYGFFKGGNLSGNEPFCSTCDNRESFRDMPKHEKRLKESWGIR
jgi:hypothetical protein